MSLALAMQQDFPVDTSVTWILARKNEFIPLFWFIRRLQSYLLRGCLGWVSGGSKHLRRYLEPKGEEPSCCLLASHLFDHLRQTRCGRHAALRAWVALAGHAARMRRALKTLRGGRSGRLAASASSSRCFFFFCLSTAWWMNNH